MLCAHGEHRPKHYREQQQGWRHMVYSVGAVSS
jgi:hypothetical protein